MGKSRRGAKEFNREQRLIHENKKLKREISRLQKLLSRLDVDRSDRIMKIVEDYYNTEESEQRAEEALSKIKNEWKCDDCGIGYLEIIQYDRAGDTYYFRKCNNCPKRTKGQKYTPEVKGILRPKDDKPE